MIGCLKAILMGIIEGVTEFLPVSSTGHMILAEKLIRLSEDPAFTAAFTVFIQSGAVLAVVILFWKQLWPFCGTNEEKKNKWVLWARIGVGVLPAAVLGLLFHEYIEARLFNPQTVAVALIFYGVVLIVFEKWHKAKQPALDSVHGLSFRTAFLIGLFQCLALVPGTSRSTATILGGMLLGLSRPLAAEFSFFLSVPTICAAGLLELSGTSFSSEQWLLLAVGFVSAFITSAAVICWLMHFLRRHSLMVFGWYRIALGAAVIWWFFR